MKNSLDKCPYCGSKYGYYTKQQVRGTVRYNFKFDGSEGENFDMYDNLSGSGGGKIAYCINCDKKLFNISKD